PHRELPLLQEARGRTGGASAKALGQKRVAAGCDLQKIQKALKMSRQLEEPQGVAEWRCIHHNVIMLATLQHPPEGQQARNLCHARQRGIQQRGNLFPVEERPVFNNTEDALAVALQEFFELALAVDLPEE